MGSQAELETQIELARRLRLGKEADAITLLDAAAEIGRILHGLRLALSGGVAAAAEDRGGKAGS